MHIQLLRLHLTSNMYYDPNVACLLTCVDDVHHMIKMLIMPHTKPEYCRGVASDGCISISALGVW